MVVLDVGVDGLLNISINDGFLAELSINFSCISDLESWNSSSSGD